MPITPLHLGPGAVIKAVTGSHFSLAVFAFSQISMDIEVFSRVVLGVTKIHGFTNTIVGASAALIPSIVLGKPLCEWYLKWWNRNLDPRQKQLLSVSEYVPWSAAVLGGVIGVYSHWFFDALMYPDAETLWPFEVGNRFFAGVAIEDLNQLYIATLVVGFGFLLGRRLFTSKWKTGDNHA